MSDGGVDILGEPLRFVLNWGRRYTLWVFNVGLACCAVEFVAATATDRELVHLGPALLPGADPDQPDEANLLVISGTLTDRMAPAVLNLHHRLPDPKYVLSFGACSNSGGPYWDSYSVTKGVDQLIPVDIYVPGCPPRPEALLAGIDRLARRIATSGSAGRSV